MSPSKPTTVAVVSTEFTWVVDGLPELTAGVPVQIPETRLQEVLALQGVALHNPEPPKE